MKLWLDDVRPAPDGWLWSSTAQSAIWYLQSHIITEASLDYDIIWSSADETDWENTQTGFGVVSWMERNNVWPVDGVKVHSANKAGAARMQAIIDRHYVVKE